MTDHLVGQPELEQTNFEKCGESKGGIHGKGCYAMFGQNQSGLAGIIRALIPFHGKAKGSEPFDAGDSFVGDPHVLCEALERLQYLRFQTLCNYKAVFVKSVQEQVN